MPLPKILDSVLEATIVGSFTKVGPSVRSRAFGWADDPDMTGTTVLLTGGSSGIGKAAAGRMVAAGATVWLTSRDVRRSESTADELNAGAGAGAGVAVGAEVDTGELDSVRRLVERVRSETGSLDVLIHNGGALMKEWTTNSTGMELTLASHLVGPYALTMGLRSHLSSGARVLWMASGGMYTQGLDVDRLEVADKGYQGTVAYARAKRAQVELVTLLGPRWAPEVTMHSMHPGWVDTDGVVDSLPGFHTVIGPLLREPDDGADTMVWLASGGADDGPAGRFWHYRRPRATSYLPGTGTTGAEREKLVDWLDAVTASH